MRTRTIMRVNSLNENDVGRYARHKLKMLMATLNSSANG